MRIIGSIYKVRIDSKMIAIRGYNKLVYLYFQNAQMNIFKRYLYEGVYIDLEYDEETSFCKNGINAFIITYVNQVYSVQGFKRIYYYDKKSLHLSLSRFLSGLGNIMFLDLEMTMPPYGYSAKAFKAEIIQAGFLLVDGNGDEICRYSKYIKPVLHPSLSKRVLSFLNIDRMNFYAQAVPYKEFYYDFKEILEQYHPTIVVYGKNDAIIMNQSYLIHQLPPLSAQTRYVNLCKLIRDYYNLRSDAGLFKMYQLYYHDESIQLHDAFNDSEVTKEVFQAFKNDVNKTTNYVEVIRNALES